MLGLEPPVKYLIHLIYSSGFSQQKYFFSYIALHAHAVRFSSLYNIIYNFDHFRYNFFMDRAIWHRKIKLSEAEKAEREYYSSLTIEKFENESRKRLRRVLKIIKQNLGQLH